MRLLLTDVLRCPRCGPEWGLILLAERITEERRVEQGRLGCANCRNAYPIRNGVLDLRLDRAASETSDGAEAEPNEDAAVRLAALLGLAAGGGRVALRGFRATVVSALAMLVPGVEVIALRADRRVLPASRVEEVLSESGFPFADRALRGVAMQGRSDRRELAEALRVVSPGERVVAEGCGSRAEAALRSLGAEILLSEGDTIVARMAVASPRSAG